MKHEKMKKLTVLAMLSAIAYVAVALLRFPVVLFLSYEPKDVVIAIGGFLYGPLAALGISLVVSFIEMLHHQLHGLDRLCDELPQLRRLCGHCRPALPQKAHAGQRHCGPVRRRAAYDRAHAAVELSHHAAVHAHGPRRRRRDARAGCSCRSTCSRAA